MAWHGMVATRALGAPLDRASRQIRQRRSSCAQSACRVASRFRHDSSADPLVLGSHRKREAVLVSYATYADLVANRPSAPTPPVLEQLRMRRRVIHRIAELNKIRSVEVFGSVARGEETPSSDIDLLVDPSGEASLFDLAQFGIDLEQILGSDVDVVSRRSLDPIRDAAILVEAVAL